MCHRKCDLSYGASIIPDGQAVSPKAPRGVSQLPQLLFLWECLPFLFAHHIMDLFSRRPAEEGSEWEIETG